MLFHFCFKQNHKIGGVKCPSPLPNEELSPRNLPKKNSTLLTVPWLFSKIETTDIYTTERRQDANRGRLAPGPGLFITPLPPAIEAVSSWTHSTSIHALQNRQARPPRWKLHGSCRPLELQKNPLLEWNKNIRVIGFTLLSPFIIPFYFFSLLCTSEARIFECKMKGGKENKQEKLGNPFITILLGWIWVKILPPEKRKFPILCIWKREAG